MLDCESMENRPFIIAGPCSAESREQIFEVADCLVKLGVKDMRAGLWKPRSRPNSFEGVGSEGVKWLSEVRSKGINPYTEVILPEHVQICLEHEIDHLWLGARTTTNPFLVDQLAREMKNKAKVVLVKNPIAPDLKLWLGAIERVQKHNPDALVMALHRGFSTYSSGKFRNDPLWDIVFHLRELRPDLTILSDPSHIAGKANLIKNVSQVALDLGIKGLFLEIHPDPVNALSDASQQLDLKEFSDLLENLSVKTSIKSGNFKDLDMLRSQIDQIDLQLIKILKNRTEIINQISKFKKENCLQIFSYERYTQSLKDRVELGKKYDLDSKVIEDIYRLIHSYSIDLQS